MLQAASSSTAMATFCATLASSSKPSRLFSGSHAVSVSRSVASSSWTPHLHSGLAMAPQLHTGRLGARRKSEEVGEVVLSQARLEELLEAEITTLALKEAQPMTLRSLLDSARNEGQLATVLHNELPVRYAQRIKMLEKLPRWDEFDSIRHIRQMYVTSFKELRLVEASQHKAFRQQLQIIKLRHTHTNLLVQGFKEYSLREDLTEEQINEWLDRFFTLRISTNMLIAQYLEMAEPKTSDGTNPYQSSIHPKCNPYAIAQHAADVIGRLCQHWYGCRPEIQVTDAGSKPFPFVPRYLFYILSELLKNAVRATVEHQSGSGSGRNLPRDACSRMVPVQVLVCSSTGVTSIRISDEGGGIPMDSLSHVWSYLYTTADPIEFPQTRDGVDAPTDLRCLDTGARVPLSSLADCTDSEALGRTDQSILLKSPLAGLGCGLPLSRLYAQYLGGQVRLQTLPRFGTDVFVYLPSLGTSSEELPSV